MAQQTKLDFSNAIAPKRKTVPTDPGPSAKRSKETEVVAPTPRKLPDPPPYEVCTPDTPELYGSELKRYVETIASTRTHPIPFEEYLSKRLSAEHNEWFTALLSKRINTDEKYPVDLDDLWPMLYQHKHHATRALEKNHVKDSGYTLPTNHGEQDSGWGGHNQVTYMLTQACARSFSTEAGNAAGRAVRDFFIKVHSVTEEFMLIDSAIREKLATLNSTEKTLLRTFGGEHVVYLGFIQPLNESSDIYSMGHTKNIVNRIKEHRKKYGQFTLVHATKTAFKEDAEQAIFHHPSIAAMRDGSLMESDIELFRVPRTDGALLSIKNTMDQVCREVCVAHGGAAHITERQAPKTPEEMQHEERMLVLKHRHETAMYKLKRSGTGTTKLEPNTIFEEHMQRLARTSKRREKWLPLLCAERADSMTDRDIKLADNIAEKMGIDPNTITEDELRARRLNHIFHYRYEGDVIYLSASGIVLWMDNEVITSLRDDEYREEFVYSDTPQTDALTLWWETMTEYATTHIHGETLLQSWNAHANRGDTIKEFNKKLRDMGLNVKKSVRAPNGIATGVENRKLKNESPTTSEDEESETE